ncbi:hypothetical protein [Winogradskyella sp. R77965]|uniref:hypothetical protein n=1 Tax=Winogradskyella sp. R77965 TaxID=3093872 RepID=UPI0037DD23F8
MTNSMNKPPIWFWILSVLALIWNALGVQKYLQQAYNTEGFRASYTTEQLALMDSTPAWATAAFAVAVFGSVLACILLLLRKKLAKTVFLIALIAIIVQMGYGLLIAKNYEVLSSFEVTMSIFVPIIGLLLYLFAKRSAEKGWIN